MKKTLLIILLMLPLMALLVNAETICHDQPHKYHTAYAHAKICVEGTNSDNIYYNGDELTIMCNAGQELYVDCQVSDCGKTGCACPQNENFYKHRLWTIHNKKTVTFLCWDYAEGASSVPNSPYWAWAAATVTLTPRIIDQPGDDSVVINQPPQETSDPQQIPESNNVVVSDEPLNWLQKIIEWIKNFFRSLGLGSLVSPVGGSGGGGGGP